MAVETLYTKAVWVIVAIDVVVQVVRLAAPGGVHHYVLGKIRLMRVDGRVDADLAIHDTLVFRSRRCSERRRR